MADDANPTTERQNRWDARYAAKELVWSVGPNEKFAQEIGGLQPGRALDVGCGEGRNSLWLAERGWQVTGMDFSRVGIDKARRIAEQRGVEVEWVIADAAAYPFEPVSYDLVAVLYMHTDPEERTQWMANVLAALKYGGTFLYIGHDPRNIEEGVGGPQDTNLLPAIDELLGYLQGYTVINAEVLHRPVQSDPGHGGSGDGIALDAFVRAVRDSPTDTGS